LLVATPVAAVLLMVTLVGIPLGLAVAALSCVALLVLCAASRLPTPLAARAGHLPARPPSSCTTGRRGAYSTIRAARGVR
jgi:hypothetical protein